VLLFVIVGATLLLNGCFALPAPVVDLVDCLFNTLLFIIVVTVVIVVMLLFDSLLYCTVVVVVVTTLPFDIYVIDLFVVVQLLVDVLLLLLHCYYPTVVALWHCCDDIVPSVGDILITC